MPVAGGDGKPGEAKPVGVDADGGFALPWLQPALQSALRQQRSHALLLHAPMDVGQLDLALCVAQAWLCEQRERAPCGQCASCRLARQRAHPDLCIVVPEAQRIAFGWLGDDDPLSRAGAKPSRDIRIEQVRDAIDWTQRSASTPRGRALVIAPVEALNLAAASALLKTLEEPPGSLRIVMAGRDPERLLPTVRSRVQRLRIDAPDGAQSAAWLKAQGLPASPRALAVAGDSPLAARELIEAGLDDRALDALPAAVARGDVQPLLGQPVPRVVDLLLRLAHDAMAQATGASPRFYDAGRMPPATALPALIEWQRELLRIAPNDEHPWNGPLLVEALVTKGARCWAGSPAAPPRSAGHSIHSSR
jgi:DNA polymerase-3 subunit delta'